ncbi:MAG: hypothetical protein Q8R60_11105 [Mycobacteriales bacterium]|nr:hypothetical protein [Mycobacteriales bacterium]
MFTGQGFSANTAIAVAEDGAPLPSTQTDASGKFSTQICYPTDAQPGERTLTGTGSAPDGTTEPTALSRFLLPAASADVTRTVSVKITITGVSQSSPSPNPGGGTTGGTGGTTGTTTGGTGGTTGTNDNDDDGELIEGGGGTIIGGGGGDQEGVLSPSPVIGLPRSGFGALVVAAVGTGLVALGSGALLFAGRRRRAHEPTATT